MNVERGNKGNGFPALMNRDRVVGVKNQFFAIKSTKIKDKVLSTIFKWYKKNARSDKAGAFFFEFSASE